MTVGSTARAAHDKCRDSLVALSAGCRGRGRGTALIALAPARRRVVSTVLATLLGLVCMESEYWVAGGFPEDEVWFFIVTAVLTLATIFLGAPGALGLGLAGLIFFAYVNIRYGAPYLPDYILPIFYALLVVFVRREMNSVVRNIWATGRVGLLWLALTNAITFWRTTELGKWVG